jgi:hypothetical protein
VRTQEVQIYEEWTPTIGAHEAKSPLDPRQGVERRELFDASQVHLIREHFLEVLEPPREAEGLADKRILRVSVGAVPTGARSVGQEGKTQVDPSGSDQSASSWRLPGEESRNRRKGESRLAGGRGIARGRLRELVDVGGRVASVAVATEMIGASRIQQEDEDIVPAVWSRVHVTALLATEEREQSRGEECCGKGQPAHPASRNLAGITNLLRFDRQVIASRFTACTISSPPKM